jgi:hypothetical protein
MKNTQSTHLESIREKKWRRFEARAIIWGIFQIIIFLNNKRGYYKFFIVLRLRRIILLLIHYTYHRSQVNNTYDSNTLLRNAIHSLLQLCSETPGRIFGERVIAVFRSRVSAPRSVNNKILFHFLLIWP